MNAKSSSIWQSTHRREGAKPRDFGNILVGLRLAKGGSEARGGALQGVDGDGGRVRGRSRGGGEGRPVEQELWVPMVLRLLFGCLQQINCLLQLLILVHPAVPRWLDALRRVLDQFAHDVPLPLLLAAGGQGGAGLEADGAGADGGGGGGGGDVEELGLPLPRDGSTSSLLSTHTDCQGSDGKGDGN